MPWTYVECLCVTPKRCATRVSGCSCRVLRGQFLLIRVLSDDFYWDFCLSNGLQVQILSDYKSVSVKCLRIFEHSQIALTE